MQEHIHVYGTVMSGADLLMEGLIQSPLNAGTHARLSAYVAKK